LKYTVSLPEEILPYFQSWKGRKHHCTGKNMQTCLFLIFSGVTHFTALDAQPKLVNMLSNFRCYSTLSEHQSTQTLNQVRSPRKTKTNAGLISQSK